MQIVKFTNHIWGILDGVGKLRAFARFLEFTKFSHWDNMGEPKFGELEEFIWFIGFRAIGAWIHEKYLVCHFVKVRLQILLRNMQEAIVLHVSSAECQQINCSQTRLLSGWHKHYHRILWGVLHDGVIGRFGHSNDSWGIVCHVEALDV